MSRPTGPPPTTTACSPGAVGPADVVDRDRGRLDQRRGSQRQILGGRRDQRRRPARSSAPACAPGESMPRKFSRWQTCGARPGRPGRSPHQRSGITVTGSPTDQPVTAGRPRRSGPDISWPITAGVVDPRVHGAVQDVQIGAADAGVGHRDLDLARTRRPVLDLQDVDHAVPVYCAARIRAASVRRSRDRVRDEPLSGAGGPHVRAGRQQAVATVDRGDRRL